MPTSHTCHWPDCRHEVPSVLWGCSTHWYALPKRLRAALWLTHVPGQEAANTPSERYRAVMAVMKAWIAGLIEIREDGSVRALTDSALPAGTGTATLQFLDEPF